MSTAGVPVGPTRIWRRGCRLTRRHDPNRRERIPASSYGTPASSRALRRGGSLNLISIVVPCFNEEETLSELHRQVSTALAECRHEIEFVFIDDGSTDATAPTIRKMAAADPRVRGLLLARNFGHEAAIDAGLREAKGDAVVVMDADLQDSAASVAELIAAWEDGADVAYAVRRNRKEGRFLRAAFSSFYRLAGRMMSIDLPKDAGPFSLMSRPVVDALNGMPEHHRYFPGLRAFAGFRQVPVEVDRHERIAGATKYSVTRRASGALNAIISFSKLPLRLVTLLGIVAAAASIIGGIFVIIASTVSGGGVPGWASIMVVVLLLAGVQLLTLGIVGEYVGKIYDEVRRRPTYIPGERIGGPEDPNP
jgi:glycosyltransferase involved in cell wall biosynthesis